MPFKDISYLELWQPIPSVERNYLCHFGRGYYEEQFCVIFFKIRPVVQEEMPFKPFKDISYLELWQPICSAKQNHLCNFVRECYEEQFCEIIWANSSDVV